jgi:hypothetical protein
MAFDLKIFASIEADAEGALYEDCHFRKESSTFIFDIAVPFRVSGLGFRV